MTMMMATVGSFPPLGVDYSATITSEGIGYGAAGPTSSVQIGTPSYSNGSGNYSWTWLRTSGSASVEISSTAVERPTFSGSSIPEGPSTVAIFQVTVVDNVYGTTATDSVTVTCTWTALPAFTVNYAATVHSTGSGFEASGVTSTTQIAAPSYTNGSGNYTYAWVRLSGSSIPAITNSTAERPGFNSGGVPVSDANPETATFQITVSDVTNGTSAVDTVEVICTWTNLN